MASESVVLMGGTGSLVSGESLVVCSEPCPREQKGPNKLCLLDEGCCNLPWSAGLAFLKFPTRFSTCCEAEAKKGSIFMLSSRWEECCSSLHLAPLGS